MSTTTSAAARVATRFARGTKSAAVLFRGVPAGWNWGWWSDGVPRLHLVPVDTSHRGAGRSWLENAHGKRTFEVEGSIPESVLDAVQVIIAEDRPRIEDAWVKYMGVMGWLTVGLQAGGDLAVTCYRCTAHERQMLHGIPWGGIIGDRDPEPDDLEIDWEAAQLVLGGLPRSGRVKVPVRLFVFRDG
jgi:hypothetical protein